MGAPLTQLDPKGDLIMHVAESFEPSDGAKKWVIRLRKGITFHNGKSLTADDVVATINYHIGPDSKSPAKEYLPGVTSVKADGPDTVVIELASGNVDLPFGFTDYHLSIYPSTDGKIEWEKGIGSGPYILKSYEPGVKLVGERNQTSSRYLVRRHEMITIADVAAHQRLSLGRSALHRPCRSQDHRHAEERAEHGNLQPRARAYTAPMLVMQPFDNPCAKPSNTPSTAGNGG
jgi:peptide/nickel transport system substrate-binding protein